MAWPPELERRIRRRLAELEAGGLLRRLRAPDGIDLSSNDYLGLSVHPRVCRAMVDAIRREGCGATASRLLRGEREAFAALERRFASFKRTEAALLFGSGYLANLGVLATIPEEGDTVFSDELNHASLIDGLRLSRARRVIYPHRDTAALERLLRAEAGAGQKFVVTESLFSMDGDEAPLVELAAVCRSAAAALIVDEAHAVGIYGARGSGLIEEAGIDADVFLSINTGGKALGVAGALVAGPQEAIDYLIQRARTLVFSTAPPPALAAALDAALTVVEEEPERRARLLGLAARLRQLLEAGGVPLAPGRSQILPVPVGENVRAVAAAERLQAAGFDVRAIRPPTVPTGTARLRVSVNAGLDEPTLLRFAGVLVAALSECRPCSAASS